MLNPENERLRNEISTLQARIDELEKAFAATRMPIAYARSVDGVLAQTKICLNLKDMMKRIRHIEKNYPEAAASQGIVALYAEPIFPPPSEGTK
jgi:hypothetical protein